MKSLKFKMDNINKFLKSNKTLIKVLEDAPNRCTTIISVLII